MQKFIYDSYLEMYYKLTSSYLFTDPSIFKHMTKTKCNPAPTCKSRSGGCYIYLKEMALMANYPGPKRTKRNKKQLKSDPEPMTLIIAPEPV